MMKNYAIEGLVEKRNATVEEIQSLKNRLNELNTAIKDYNIAIKSLGGNVKSSVGNKNIRPAGSNLKVQIADLLKSNQNGLSPKEIADKLTESGRPTKNTTVSSSLALLKKSGDITKSKSGKWIINPKD